MKYLAWFFDLWCYFDKIYCFFKAIIICGSLFFDNAKRRLETKSTQFGKVKRKK